MPRSEARPASTCPQGKNLVGAFWQPSGVVCDLDALETLPARELRCGYGEMAKYHFLTGDDLLAMPLTDRVARCVEIKADVVASDEREGGRRALLNYGHTLAHALEIATESRSGPRRGGRDRSRLRRPPRPSPRAHRRCPRRRALRGRRRGPTGCRRRCRPVSIRPTCSTLMGRDKKALDGLTFVLDGPHGVEVVAGVEPAPSSRRWSARPMIRTDAR